MDFFADILNKVREVVHIHTWDYERHNAVIIRSCGCTATEQGIIYEDPELISTAPTRQRDVDKMVWRRV